MELERCYSVLAVSSSQKFNESIRGLLPESRYFPVTVMRDAASARRELLEQSYDLVIINAPLTDEFGTRLALDVWAFNEDAQQFYASADFQIYRCDLECKI